MKLSQRIWITRKSRINAAARLERYDFWSQLLITWYSTLIAIFSILSLYNSNAEILSLMLISLSILVLTLSLFIGTRGFKERSLHLKNCYIKLNELRNKAECLEENSADTCDNDYQAVQKDYNDILILFENHTKFDYLKTLYEAKNTNPESQQEKDDQDSHNNLNSKLQIYFWSRRVGFVVFVGFLFFFPIILGFVGSKLLVLW